MQRSTLMNFRASPQLAKALKAVAASDGVSVSEVVRQAVEDRLAKQPSEPSSTSAFDPFDKLSGAARGGLQAQRELARRAVSVAVERDEAGELVNDPERCLIEGLVFARLAAAHGDLADQGLVISMLALLVELVGEENAGEELAEATARAFLAADHGNDDIADALPWLSANLQPHVMRLAKEYAGRIKDRCVAQ